MTDDTYIDNFNHATAVDRHNFTVNFTKRQLGELYPLVGDFLDFGLRHQRQKWDELLIQIGWVLDDFPTSEAGGLVTMNLASI